MLLLTTLATLVAGISSGLMPSYTTYTICRVVVAVAMTAKGHAAFVTGNIPYYRQSDMFSFVQLMNE